MPSSAASSDPYCSSMRFGKQEAGATTGRKPSRAPASSVREVVGVELGEAGPVGGRVVDAGEVRVARRARAQLDAAEALVDVVVPRRLAELAIADDVDAGVALRLDDVADRPRQAFLVGLLVVVLAGVDLAQVRDQLRGTDEAADMRRADGRVRVGHVSSKWHPADGAHSAGPPSVSAARRAACG